MLTPEDNALLTRVDPGTPMHAAFKRYWLPAARSADLAEKDSDPVRLTLLCENYIMFRDSAGKVGILREGCCHRGASLVLGRVEHGGIRCIFHGWKFDVAGRILEMPNATDNRYLDRYRQPSYPVREAAGLIWVYLGPADKEPPFPKLPFLQYPDAHIVVEHPVANANYVQMIEGLVDTSHVGVLHSDALRKNTDVAVLNPSYKGAVFKQMSSTLAPELEAEDTDFGFRYVGLRRSEEDGKLVRVARIMAFALPCFGFIGNGNTMVAAVPATNERTNFFHIWWDANTPFDDERRKRLKDYYGVHDEAMFGWGLASAFRDLPTSANYRNNFLQDREGMRRNETFSGIMNFVAEDVAIAESMGPIVDRSAENLIGADVAVSRMRRVLMDNARRVQHGGEPLGLAPKEPPRGVMGVLHDNEDWRILLKPAQQKETELV